MKPAGADAQMIGSGPGRIKTSCLLQWVDPFMGVVDTDGNTGGKRLGSAGAADPAGALSLFIKEIANRDSLGSSQASKWIPYVDSVLRKIESCNDSSK